MIKRDGFARVGALRQRLQNGATTWRRFMATIPTGQDTGVSVGPVEAE